MKKSVRTLLVCVILAAVALLTACGENKAEETERLKAEIVGMWVAEGGPEYVYNDNIGEGYYTFYEFTSDNKLVYHNAYEHGDIYNDDTVFEIRDDLFVVDGASCRIAIDGDRMVMTNNNGDTVYERLSVEEAAKWKVYYIDSELYNQQIDYIDSTPAESESTADESTADESAAE